MDSELVASQSIDQNTAALTEQDRRILDSVERFLADGLTLKRWWDQVYPANGFAERFELERVFNRPDSSFGFFDRVALTQGDTPVMGNYQEMLYDQTRTPAILQRQGAKWMRDQIREFVLHYFMRVSAFRQPEAFTEPDRHLPPRYLERLSWCTQSDIQRAGFGFSQLYYKLRETGQVGKFSRAEQSAIIDLREIGQSYEWIVTRVNIFDFKFTFKPFGSGQPEFSVPLTEESYLVLSRDFILNQDNPSPGLLGEYGLGYAFIKEPTTGLIAYGPGEFDAAIELINFRVKDNGETRVEMVFVANRPEAIANVRIDPVDWSFRFADTFSLGLSSRLFGPMKNALETVPTSIGSFDPVYSFIAAANTLSCGQAARDWCISRKQLDRDFLLQHFMQHYTTIVGSLMTWRQIPNWLDRAALPEWVVTGKSA